VVAVSDIATSIDDIDVDAMTERIVEEINRPRKGDMTEQGGDGYMDPGDLPGFGEPYDDCDDDILHFCTDCGATFPLGRTCSRSECPRCAPMWDVDKAENNTARLQTVAKTMSARLGVSVKKHHLVFSPPDDWYLEAEDVVDRTRQVVKEILDLMNAEGLVAFHGWTGRESDDRGAWKERLFNGRDWEGDVRDELRPNGHFHCIVASPFIVGGEVTRRVEEETGWLIKRVTKQDGSGKSLADIKDVARAMTYVLSHTTIRVNENANNSAEYRAFGSIWHDDKVNVYDNVRRQAERAVRSVAPTTLGVSKNSMRCETPIPSDEQADDAVEMTDTFDSGGDSEHDPSDGCDGSGTADDDDLVDCKGAVKPITDAEEYLDDDEWVTESIYSHQLLRDFEEWKAKVSLDRPPPLLAAFSK